MSRVFALAALLAVLLTGCQTQSADKRPLIVVSIHPYELLVKQLVGEDFRVETLIPPGASPHTYSPRPQDLKNLKQARLVLINGFGLEKNLHQALDKLGDKCVSAEALLAGKITPEPEGINPHIWLSPRKLEILTLGLNARLQKEFPSHKELIATNAGSLYTDLAGLDEQLRSERAAYGKTPVITFHDSFHHLFRDYGIDYLGSVQESPGSEPTPRELARLGQLIKDNGVKAICVEPQFDRRSAAALVREFGLKIVVLDPLGSSLKPQPQSLTDIIRANWQNLKQTWQPIAGQS